MFPVVADVQLLEEVELRVVELGRAIGDVGEIELISRSTDKR